MKCVFCKHGSLKPGEGSLLFKRGERTYFIRQLPALVCDTCGEEYFTDEVMADLEDSFERHTVAQDAPIETRNYISGTDHTQPHA